jgi:hypothetical protein
MQVCLIVLLDLRLIESKVDVDGWTDVQESLRLARLSRGRVGRVNCNEKIQSNTLHTKYDFYHCKNIGILLSWLGDYERHLVAVYKIFSRGE